jgi:hypothetical protein
MPDKDELDGVRLDNMEPGTVREVSTSIGAWLIAEGFAELEMRRPVEEDPFDVSHDLPAAPDKRGRHPPASWAGPESAHHRRRKTD